MRSNQPNSSPSPLPHPQDLKLLTTVRIAAHSLFWQHQVSLSSLLHIWLPRNSMKLLQFILFYLRNDLAIEVETVFEFFGQTPPGTNYIYHNLFLSLFKICYVFLFTFTDSLDGTLKNHNAQQ